MNLGWKMLWSSLEEWLRECAKGLEPALLRFLKDVVFAMSQSHRGDRT